MNMENNFSFDTIHGDFEKAAKKHPTNTAVWTESGTINYDELDKLSNSFASWLIEKGHAPNKRIALILPKKIETIVAIFGVLKAGSTYVPLGDTWPANRLNAIIENGDFQLVLVEKDIPEVSLKESRIMRLGSIDWEEATSLLTKNSLSSVKIAPTDIAYILYTSGSTGVPKGVCVSHKAAQFFPAWALNEFNVDTSHKIASIAPFTFDLSTFDLFTGLSSGGCLYLVPEKYKMFPSRLSSFLEKYQITTMYAVPSALSLLTLNGNLEKRDFSHFKTVLFAGEVFPIDMCRKFRAFLPKDVQYYNLYGPTETNVCTYFDASVIPEGDDNLPIGIPLPETIAYIDVASSDDKTSGELCIYGPTLMSGYWGKPNEGSSYWTPLPNDKSKFAYRTGDVTYQDKDANWIYKGRADKMVKIWGYRVELGEIESGILKHPKVEQCAVVKRDKKDKLGEELVAFVIPKGTSDNDELNHNELFKHCKSYLPHFMIPSHIYELEEFPLNNSSKIDRLSLEKQAQDYVNN